MIAVGLAVPAWASQETRRGTAPSAAGVADVPTALAWHRLFLLDGQVVSIVGEFTRVDDMVMAQLPVGAVGSDGVPQARTVSIPSATVDWTRTDAYRDTLRRAQFERAGGERAYAAFTEEVAAMLRDIALLQDPLERISRLERARAHLAQWPIAHHGHRADDVAKTLSVVDDLIAGMRAAAGEQTFSLALTAGAASAAPPPAAVLAPPTLHDMVAQALALAPRVSAAAERMVLLRAAESLLVEASAGEDWTSLAHAQVRRQIADETRVTSRYARLGLWMLDCTARLLAAADVRGLLRTRDILVKRDAAMGRQRPAEMASLLATLDVRLDAARRHRLRLERWQERRVALQAYASVVSPWLSPKEALARALEDIKALSGPEAALLAQAESQLAAARSASATVAVPDEARAIQQVWASTQQFAARAIDGRRAAIRSGDMQQAWDASAAAAGALMLLQQLRTDVPVLLRPPAPPAPGS